MQHARFPTELTERPQWLLYRLIRKPGAGKPAKMPYYIDGGVREGVQGGDEDRSRLATYGQACATLERGGFDGLGFAFLPGDGLIGIDLDAALPTDRQAKVVEACGTYAEDSPSGTGVHIIGTGQVETFKDNGVGIEVFCGRQFFTMTGRSRGGAPFEIRPIPADALDKLRRTVEQAKAARRAEAAPAPAAPATSRAPAVQANASAERYCRQAFMDALQRVRQAGEGTRNDTLNGEAFGLGQLLHLGVFTEHEAAAALQAAAEAAGLDAGEIAPTIRSGLTAGREKPRAVPEREQRQQQRPASPASAPRVDPETGEILQPAANDNRPRVKSGAGYDLEAVDWWAPFPDANGKGKPLSTITNVQEACRRLGVTVRYNVIRKDQEILIPGEGFSIDNAANASLAWLTSCCVRFGVPTGELQGYLTFMGDKNLYNPVAQWITSKPWDRQSRMMDLYDTIHADAPSQDLKQSLILRWLISAVAAAFRPSGVSAHGVLVLQGDQYLGKTKWFKALAPAELGVIQDGLTLQPNDKDSVKNVVRNWLVELGELDATFRKSDIAQLKSFLTKDRDVLRRPYDRRESEFARRTVFFASVNPRQFLHDPTGNRRYWTIPCDYIEHDHNVDMQQVWAEVYEAHFKTGATWYLTPEEMQALNDQNKDHEVLDPIRERLQTRLDWEAEQPRWRWMTATDIMSECGFDRPTQGEVTRCGQIIQELNGKRRKTVRGKSLAYVPPRVFHQE